MVVDELLLDMIDVESDNLDAQEVGLDPEYLGKQAGIAVNKLDWFEILPEEETSDSFFFLELGSKESSSV